MINDNPTYSIPTGKLDGYHIFLHELGHGISLSHVVDTTRIMSWETPPGYTASTSKVIDLTKDAAAYIGEGYVLQRSKSETILYTQGSSAFPMRSITKCTSLHAYGNSVANISSINKWVNVYPNPTSDYLTFVLDGSMTGLSVIRIFNMCGAEMYTFTNDFVRENRPINVESLPKGIYLLTITNAKFCESFKIVKQ